MNNLKSTIIGIALVIFASSLVAGESTKTIQTITWTSWDNPPAYVLKGKDKGLGIQDQIERELIGSLKGYIHEQLQVNIARVLQMAKEDETSCNAGWLDTPEWRELFYFSKPAFVIKSNGAIMRKDKAKKFGYNQKITLDKLLAEKNLRLGVSRAYGKGIDQVLEQYKYKNNPLIDVVSSDFLAHQMLRKGRVDFIIGYPIEINYYRQMSNDKTELIYLPLEENEDTIEVVIACSKTATGRQVIDQVNELLDKERLKRFEKYQDYWLSPIEIKNLTEDRQKFYRKLGM